jgi:hypothetical protein
MNRTAIVTAAFLAWAGSASAYVEIPYTLGRVVNESTHIVLMKVEKVNKERRLIYYRKVADLKGKHPTDTINHQITNGFNAREPKFIMDWAEPGKTAIFFHNGGASETCIGDYWYQAYAGNPWWNMSHAEPFMCWAYSGAVDKLEEALKAMLAGKEVVVPCAQFDPAKVQQVKNLLHEKKAPLWQMRAGLKIADYDACIRNRAQFVTALGDPTRPAPEELVLIAEGAGDWRWTAAAAVKGEAWLRPDFDDSKWPAGKAPLGYGEDEIAKRRGTVVDQRAQDLCVRRTFDVDSRAVKAGVTVTLYVASDDSATVWINGRQVDQEVGDHEFAYWNRTVQLPAGALVAGRNVIAVRVHNHAGSSDAYLDVRLEAAVPREPEKPKSAGR